MYCKCGYQFNLRTLRKAFKSYFVVEEKKYISYLKCEMRVLRARTEKTKVEAISIASTYTGGIYICPQCSRLLFLKPKGNKIEYYQRDVE